MKPDIGINSFDWTWAMHCPNKIRHFLWLCQHNRLPTRAHLNAIGINISNLCHICNKRETIKHILECRLTRKVWKHLGIHNEISILSFQQYWLKILYNQKVEQRNLQSKEAFPFYLWNIWLTRNDNFHNNK